MTDKLTKIQRSKNMAKIKNRNTKIEVSFRKKLFKKGVRYLLSYPLFGKPDLVIPSKKTAIFIDGCFWHRHNKCKLSYMPKSNRDFWNKKLTGNIRRDKKVNSELRKKGWQVIRIWECEIEKDMDKIINKTVQLLNL